MSNRRGIYLVANQKSETHCANLIASIRNTGCTLPIRLIHFGGTPVQQTYIYKQVEVVDVATFPQEAFDFINNLQEVLTDCPKGFLLRFLAWFGDWDEFIYSDNDIVALCNWDIFFEHLQDHDFVHADFEYKAKGKYNFNNPEAVGKLFGEDKLNTAFTAGHFAARRKREFIDDFYQAMDWYRAHPTIAKKHDQAFMHIASLLGNWNILNLCKAPHNWLSSWAGDYNNTLDLIHALQKTPDNCHISHIHYSGGYPSGTHPVHELLFAKSGYRKRLTSLVINGSIELLGITYLLRKKKRLTSRLNQAFKSLKLFTFL
ncbi:hypothetical protein [Sabulibacter ruber]|uniref:hypothetical protein n=1 Tax=Sabulibacter ruber TaxID=2811901 RepID=UPI001A974F68|nr:hypothetical protein [Sabulibacter ruber]